MPTAEEQVDWARVVLEHIKLQRSNIERVCDGFRASIKQAREAGEEPDYNALGKELVTVLLAYEAMTAPYANLLTEIGELQRKGVS